MVGSTGEPLPDGEPFAANGPLRADRWSYCTTGYLRACELAATASRRRDLNYALALLGLSQSLAATHVIDLDPSHWYHGAAVSPFPTDHVRLAYSIVAAYAVLEQLGIEVRATTNRPSRHGATWDPKVRVDLAKRLAARGVDVSEPAIWVTRGTPRRVNRSGKTKPLGRAPWAGGRIRDAEIDLLDAIADLSWLRSKVASHRLDESAESLTPYDVENAQYLARRLFASAAGWWHKRPEAPREDSV